jgi:hypothetical protein
MRARKDSSDERFAWMRERQAQRKVVPDNGTPLAFEEPLTVKQAAPIWGQSVKATRRYFATLVGVRVIPHPRHYDEKRKRYKQKYDTVLIPPSVLEREIRKTTNA